MDIIKEDLKFKFGKPLSGKALVAFKKALKDAGKKTTKYNRE